MAQSEQTRPVGAGWSGLTGLEPRQCFTSLATASPLWSGPPPGLGEHRVLWDSVRVLDRQGVEWQHFVTVARYRTVEHGKRQTRYGFFALTVSRRDQLVRCQNEENFASDAAAALDAACQASALTIGKSPARATEMFKQMRPSSSWQVGERLGLISKTAAGSCAAVARGPQ